MILRWDFMLSQRCLFLFLILSCFPSSYSRRLTFNPALSFNIKTEILHNRYFVQQFFSLLRNLIFSDWRFLLLFLPSSTCALNSWSITGAFSIIQIGLWHFVPNGFLRFLFLMLFNLSCFVPTTCFVQCLR